MKLKMIYAVYPTGAIKSVLEGEIVEGSKENCDTITDGVTLNGLDPHSLLTFRFRRGRYQMADINIR